MKTENTLENKARFFAQYYDQEVAIETSSGFNANTIDAIRKSWIKGYHLELIPLSQITDEDLKHLSKIDLVSSREYDDSVTDEDLIEFGKYEFLNSERDLKYLLPEAVDFIRSKGYALNWMGLSVEDLVKYGWIKLKKLNDEKNN